MTLPSPHPRVLARRLGDEVVLVHLDTNQIYTLNETGARFWELVTEHPDRATIERTLRAEFDVTDETVAAEVNRLVAELSSLGLLR